MAYLKKQPYQTADASQESKGIDGYIGSTPISIKPITYKTKDMFIENIDAKLIYYEKDKKGIKITYDF